MPIKVYVLRSKFSEDAHDDGDDIILFEKFGEALDYLRDMYNYMNGEHDENGPTGIEFHLDGETATWDSRSSGGPLWQLYPQETV